MRAGNGARNVGAQRESVGVRPEGGPSDRGECPFESTPVSQDARLNDAGLDAC